MNLLAAAIRVAGALQVLDIARHLALPRRIRCRKNLARLWPRVRQIFLVHCFYILRILRAACPRFALELAGRFLSRSQAIFWLLRAGLEVFSFDGDLRQQNRMGHFAFTLFAALRPIL